MQEIIDQLISQTDEHWSRHHYSRLVFQDIAAEVLSNVNPAGVLRVSQILEYLAQPRHHASSWVSDNAAEDFTLFQGRDFSIYVHVWMDTLAQPHHHNWSGAYQIVSGESLTGFYSFHLKEQIDYQMAFGRLQTESVRLLDPGSVVKVTSGPSMIHGLQYLQKPGLAISIRLNGTGEAQTTYLRPGIAYINTRSCHVEQHAKALNILRLTEPKAYERVFVGIVDKTDLITLFNIIKTALENRWGVPESVYHLAHLKHGSHFTLLEKGFEDILLTHFFAEARDAFKQRDLRFMLGALSYADTREDILKLFSTYFPEQEPQELIGHLLAGLLITVEQDDEFPEYMGKGFGMLAFGASLDEVRTTITNNYYATEELEDHLGFMLKAQEAMALAPIYRPLFN